MKKTLSYVLSGMIGGLFCFLLINQFPAKTTIIQEVAPQSKQVSLTNLPVVGPDFVTAAKVSTPAVVHIYAEESTESAQDRLEKERRRNPFGGDLFSEFFGGGDFFGRNYYRQSGTGSGVIISKDGYIVTNNHVVGFADNITVTTHQGKKYNGKKVGTDPSTDLAVIKIEGDFTPAVFGDSDKLNVGEWVLAVGNPFDYLTSTVTAGIVSAKGRSLDIIKDEKAIEEFIQTDAAINPGNSGGALVDVNGKLIGINTAIATPTGVFAGYSFAIPSNLVKPIIDKIIQYGDLERVELGIGGYDVDEEFRKDYKLGVKHGFYVDQLQQKSPAKRSGVLPGDVIVKINQNDIKSYDDIENVMSLSNVGDKIDITVNRGGKELKIPTQLYKTN